MATISIDIGANGNRIQDAFAAQYGYQATIPDGSGGTIPNPESKNQFTKRKIAEYVKDVVKGHEANLAADAARATAAASVESGVIIT